MSRISIGWCCFLVACSLFDRGPGAKQSTQAWHAPGAVTRGPVTSDGNLVFAVGNDHVVTAYRSADGGIVWSVRADSGATRTAVTYGGCALALTLVVCGDNGDLVGFRRDDGHVLWRYQPAEGRDLDGQPFIVSDSTIYAATWFGGVLHALDARTGTARWTFAVPGLQEHGLSRTPAVDSAMVVLPITYDGNPREGAVIALDRLTGAELWQQAIPRMDGDRHVGATDVVLWNGLVIVSANSGRIFAFLRGTGEPVWSLPGVGSGPPDAPLPNRPVNFDYRAMAIVGSTLFASSAPGWLVAYDLNSQSELWRSYPKTADCDGSPIVTDGTHVYVPYLQGAVVVFDLDGRVRSIAGKNELYGSAALGNDRFFVGSESGVYAFYK